LLHASVPAEQHLLDGTSRIAIIVQISLTAASGVLFLLVIAAAAESVSRPIAVALRQPSFSQHQGTATLFGRSPPAF
jgi:hypothetical protein